MTMFQNTLRLDEGWEIMQRGIDKLQNILEEQPEQNFSSEEYMVFYTTIYRMCSQKPPYNYSSQLYDKYRGVFVEYITSTVLPSLKNKQGELMLRELLKRWQKYKVMECWLSRFFSYLDRHFVARTGSLPTLNEVALTCFRDLVFEEMKGKVSDAVISLTDQEREGGQIDRGLLKNVEDISVELGTGQQIDRYKWNAMEDSFMNLEIATDQEMDR